MSKFSFYQQVKVVEGYRLAPYFGSVGAVLGIGEEDGEFSYAVTLSEHDITISCWEHVDFPRSSRHASITPQQENTDAGDDHGEENSAVQH
ncbi:hypothetical protein ACPF7Z_19320 [Halomonas sp. GXIMD04776]|uniref:hypothetical protein n=1 Tax=Halomonas sp. GXIMD04776 TaxID=3415605 RepID=UPI003C9519B8